jgi:hypothetical protein
MTGRLISAITGGAALLVWSAICAVPAAAAGAPTFSREVAPILYKDCANCHRPGEIAPMSLLTYEQARPWAKSIREKVLRDVLQIGLSSDLGVLSTALKPL